MIKTRAMSRSLICFIILATALLAGCTRIKFGLYDMAIHHEYKKAGLCLKSLDLDGKSIAYLESKRDAEKPDMVLLHGFGANKENWVRFAAYLTGDFHVIAVDLPGHGDSFKDLNLRYDLDDQVGYLHEIFGRLGLKRFHLAGNSMGGAISCLYAASYPDQVQSLLLIDPGGIYQYECELTRQLKAGKNPLIVKKPADFDNLMDLALEKRPFIPWPITSVMAEKSAENRAINEKIFSDITGAHRYSFQYELGKITAPTLILWGAEDRVIAPENAALFEQMISHSKKIILDGIGHAAMIEAPEMTARIYRQFLSGLKKAENKT